MSPVLLPGQTAGLGTRVPHNPGDSHIQPAFGDLLLQGQGWGDSRPGEEAGQGGHFSVKERWEACGAR